MAASAAAAALKKRKVVDSSAKKDGSFGAPPRVDHVLALPKDTNTAVLLVYDSTPTGTNAGPVNATCQGLLDIVARASLLDDAVKSSVTVHQSGVGNLLVSSPTGPLGRDFDDVRRFGDAAAAGMTRCIAAGKTSVTLVVIPPAAHLPYAHVYEKALEVALLGAMGACYEPLEYREARGAAVERIQSIPVFRSQQGAEKKDDALAKVLESVRALEFGRRLTRDIGCADPERMAPMRVWEYVSDVFAPYSDVVKLSCISDNDELEKEWPLLHAVARASIPVERHRPCVIVLEYDSSGEEKKDHDGAAAAAPVVLGLAGKGVTYDTGGADVKAGGIMAGMSRDKLGAAAVAGFMMVLALLKPRGLRVRALMGMVRNSIGSNGYVADEIITSHGGVRVRVGNTDAEGRMVLADCLSHLRSEYAVKQPQAQLFSVATLTGHAALAYGPYTAVIDSGAAQAAGTGDTLRKRGDEWGDCCELSSVKREDFAFVTENRPTKADELMQCNTAASSRTKRGHQFPAAFLSVASGLNKHGRHSDKPIAFTHLDIAGSADPGFLGKGTGAPVVALSAMYVLPRL